MNLTTAALQELATRARIATAVFDTGDQTLAQRVTYLDALVADLMNTVLALGNVVAQLEHAHGPVQPLD